MSKLSKSRKQRAWGYYRSGNEVGSSYHRIPPEVREENRQKRFKKEILKNDKYYNTLNSIHISIDDINQKINTELKDKEIKKLLKDEANYKRKFDLTEANRLSKVENELNKLMKSEEEKSEVKRKIRKWENAINNVLYYFNLVIEVLCEKDNLDYPIKNNEFSIKDLALTYQQGHGPILGGITLGIWFDIELEKGNKGFHPYFKANFHNITSMGI